MADNYVTVEVADLLVGEPLPVTLSIYIEFRFVVFRAEGNAVEKAAYDRLQFKNIKHLFILEKDRAAWDAWVAKWKSEGQPKPLPAGVDPQFTEAREDAQRKMLDIFQSTHPDKAVAGAIAASKKLVLEVMKLPYAAQTLSHLQTYSRGTVDHSINVSILSVYLAMNMGYTHQAILQHLSTGGLLHDIGKAKVPLSESDAPDEAERKMQMHPKEGAKILKQIPQVPNEVVMIVAQHHEFYDGTGYPEGMRGSKIYDLARIVAIANTFDELVANEIGTLPERQKKALIKLDTRMYKKFDPQKIEKAIKILKIGI